MLKAFTLSSVLGAAALVAAPAAHASPLMVDFGYNGQPSEIGWQTFSAATGTSNDDDITGLSETFVTDFGSGTATIAFEGGQPGVDVREYEDIESLAAGVPDIDGVLTDVFRENGPGDVEDPAFDIRISGLSAGLYSWLSYHHLPHSTGTRGPVSIDLSVDGGMTFVNVVDGLNQSEGVANIAPATAEFQFTASGVSDVVLRFHDGSVEVEDNILINGLQLNVVPEPASLGLLACGGLVMLRRRH